MRIAVISDIHGNVRALEAVLTIVVAWSSSGFEYRLWYAHWNTSGVWLPPTLLA